jgi:hypothetical protein
MKKRIGYYVTALIGVTLLIGGWVLLRVAAQPQGIMNVLPYVLIGIGCGLFGQGMGNAVSQRIVKAHPETARQIQIEQQDERNIAIASRAKAKAFDLMTFVFGALMLCFALMQVELAAVLLLVGAYLFVEGYAVYYRIKIEQEM